MKVKVESDLVRNFNANATSNVFISILQVFDEVDQIHPSTHSFCHRFREGFATVLPNVLKLAEGKTPLAKQCTDARKDALAEDLPGS